MSEAKILLKDLVQVLLETGASKAPEDPGVPAETVDARLDRFFGALTAPAATASNEGRTGNPEAGAADGTVGTEVEAEDVQAAKGNWSNRFARQRGELGIDIEHPNLFFVDVLLTRADTVAGNANHDVIPLEELRKAEASLLLQPIDVSPLFDRHMRERLWDDNGIRGVIYASEIVESDGTGEDGKPLGAALWVGVAVWARDFPEIANSILLDHDILGASFDLVFGRSAENADGSRTLFDVKFLGGAILYKTRAAIETTELGYSEYQGVDLLNTDASGGSKQPMETEITQAVEVATAQAKTTIAEQMETITEQTATIADFDAKVKGLEAENARLEAELKDAAEALSQAKAQLEAIELEKRIAAQRDARMAEFDQIRLAFASDEERAEMVDKVGALSDEEYASTKTQVMLAAAARREEELQRLLADATSQLENLKAPAETSETAQTEKTAEAEKAADAADATGAEDAAGAQDAEAEKTDEGEEIVGELVTAADAGDTSVAQAGPLSAMNSGATKLSPEDAAGFRKTGRNIAAVLSGR